jgi:hypothetical protein
MARSSCVSGVMKREAADSVTDRHPLRSPASIRWQNLRADPIIHADLALVP